MTNRVWEAFLTDADRQHRPAPTGPRADSALARRTVAVHLDDPTAPAGARERIARLLESLRARPVRVHDVLPDTGAAGLSAFFGSPLLSLLVREGAETVVLFGGAASGRLRATAVDAASSGFAVIVVEDCVWDVIEASRAIALYDIDRLYGTVVDSAHLAPDPPSTHVGHEHAGAHETQAHHAHGSGYGSDGPPPMTALPRAVLAALPGGALPVSTAHHPIHGHVISRAGDSVLAAVTESMTSGFGSTPHVVTVLRAEDVTDQPDLRRALDQTAGGVLVIGVGYRMGHSAEHGRGPGAREPAPAPHEPARELAESCPECGLPAARTEEAPADRSGHRALLYICDECGAAWDV
jgi:hypothetical protein